MAISSINFMHAWFVSLLRQGVVKLSDAYIWSTKAYGVRYVYCNLWLNTSISANGLVVLCVLKYSDRFKMETHSL